MFVIVSSFQRFVNQILDSIVNELNITNDGVREYIKNIWH